MLEFNHTTRAYPNQTIRYDTFRFRECDLALLMFTPALATNEKVAQYGLLTEECNMQTPRSKIQQALLTCSVNSATRHKLLINHNSPTLWINLQPFDRKGGVSNRRIRRHCWRERSVVDEHTS